MNRLALDNGLADYEVRQRKELAGLAEMARSAPTAYRRAQARLKLRLRKAATLRDRQDAPETERAAAWRAVSRMVKALGSLTPASARRQEAKP